VLLLFSEQRLAIPKNETGVMPETAHSVACD